MHLVRPAFGLIITAVGITACASHRSTPEEPRVAAVCLERPTASSGGVAVAEAPDRTASNEAYQRGLAQADQGEHAAAIETFAAAIAADPTNAAAHLSKAESHLAWDGDMEATRHHLAMALVLAPDTARAHVRFAQYLSGTGDPDGAAIHYRCALSLDPKLTDARVELATQLINAGHHAAALFELERVASTNQEVGFRLQALMASALEGQGRFAPAAEHMEKAAEATRSAVLYRRAADLLVRAGDEARAEALRSKADEIDPPPERPKMRPLVKAKPPPKKKKSRRRKRRR